MEKKQKIHILGVHSETHTLWIPTSARLYETYVVNVTVLSIANELPSEVFIGAREALCQQRPIHWHGGHLCSDGHSTDFWKRNTIAQVYPRHSKIRTLPIFKQHYIPTPFL